MDSTFQRNGGERPANIVDLQRQGITIDTKIQQLDAHFATKLENLDAKVDTILKFQDLEQQPRNHLDTLKVNDLKVTMEANTVKIQNDLLLLNGFSCQEFPLTELRNNKQSPSIDTGVVEGLLHKGGGSHSKFLQGSAAGTFV